MFLLFNLEAEPIRHEMTISEGKRRFLIMILTQLAEFLCGISPLVVVITTSSASRVSAMAAVFKSWIVKCSSTAFPLWSMNG